jgi:hypothetical protein
MSEVTPFLCARDCWNFWVGWKLFNFSECTSNMESIYGTYFPTDIPSPNSGGWHTLIMGGTYCHWVSSRAGMRSSTSWRGDSPRRRCCHKRDTPLTGGDIVSSARQGPASGPDEKSIARAFHGRNHLSPTTRPPPTVVKESSSTVATAATSPSSSRHPASKAEASIQKARVVELYGEGTVG